MQATIGYNPSYAWRSIQQAIWIIHKGSCWKIGDGQLVRIWEDNWIPTHHNFKPITPNAGNNAIQYVKDLIHMEDSKWNTNILNQLFLPINIK